MNFILSNSEIELLIQFEQYPSLEAVSQQLGRDPTAVSRQLKSISQKSNFLTKVSGRWKLSPTGSKLNQISRDYILAQNRLTQNQLFLRVGSTREFAANVLAKNYQGFKEALGVEQLSITALDLGVEMALIGGEIDLGFDCGRPYSPDISFQSVLEEPISVVVSSKLYKSYKDTSSLESKPHIFYERIDPEKYISKSFTLKNIALKTNDIGTAKNLCLHSVGWAMLPNYAIQKELQSGALKILGDLSFSETKFGVYCLRGRSELKESFHKATQWLKSQKALFQ